jgi:hypothetical protein
MRKQSSCTGIEVLSRIPHEVWYSVRTFALYRAFLLNSRREVFSIVLESNGNAEERSSQLSDSSPAIKDKFEVERDGEISILVMSQTGPDGFHFCVLGSSRHYVAPE